MRLPVILTSQIVATSRAGTNFANEGYRARKFLIDRLNWQNLFV